MASDTDLISELKARGKLVAEVAARDFAELVVRYANDESIGADFAQAALTAAGKTVDDLQQAVRVELERRQLDELIAGEPEVRERMVQRAERKEEAQRKFNAAQREFHSTTEQLGLEDAADQRLVDRMNWAKAKRRKLTSDEQQAAARDRSKRIAVVQDKLADCAEDLGLDPNGRIDGRFQHRSIDGKLARIAESIASYDRFREGTLQPDQRERLESLRREETDLKALKIVRQKRFEELKAHLAELRSQDV